MNPRSLRVAALALLLASMGVAPRSARAEPRPQWSPERLSPASRSLVHLRMQDHANQMGRLVWDVVLLDYDRAARSATELARGATPLDRNAPELEHHVYFFTLQDQLRTRALSVAEAAVARDGLALAAAFKQVSETCVHCHVVYLEPTRGRRFAPPIR